MNEKIEFKPNVGNFNLSLKEINSYLKIWKLRERDLKNYFLSLDPSLRNDAIKKYEEENKVKLSEVFSVDFYNLSLDSKIDELTFGNGARLIVDSKNEKFIIKGVFNSYSGDYLMVGQMIEDYRLWQPGGYALWSKATDKTKEIRSFGWKNVAYRKWYKNSLKLE